MTISRRLLARSVACFHRSIVIVIVILSVIVSKEVIVVGLAVVCVDIVIVVRGGGRYVATIVLMFIATRYRPDQSIDPFTRCRAITPLCFVAYLVTSLEPIVLHPLPCLFPGHSCMMEMVFLLFVWGTSSAIMIYVKSTRVAV